MPGLCAQHPPSEKHPLRFCVSSAIPSGLYACVLLAIGATAGDSSKLEALVGMQGAPPVLCGKFFGLVGRALKLYVFGLLPKTWNRNGLAVFVCF